MADPAQTLLLFGATGDLSRRMLLPSLFGLHADGLLPADLQIYGTARSQIDDGAFRETAGSAGRLFSHGKHRVGRRLALSAPRKDRSEGAELARRPLYREEVAHGGTRPNFASVRRDG